jgi:BTB/POZ domain
MAGLATVSLEKLLHDNEFADFTISCGNKDFKVHRAIICADSHFFQAVCKYEFKVRFIEINGTFEDADVATGKRRESADLTG